MELAEALSKIINMTRCEDEDRQTEGFPSLKISLIHGEVRMVPSASKDVDELDQLPCRKSYEVDSLQILDDNKTEELRLMTSPNTYDTTIPNPTETKEIVKEFQSTEDRSIHKNNASSLNQTNDKVTSWLLKNERNASTPVNKDSIIRLPSIISTKDNQPDSYQFPNTNDIFAEDFFYVTECPDINYLRSLSLLNRWTETEFVVYDDVKDITKLNDEELDFYRFIFVFLSAADDLVNINIGNLNTLFRQKDIQHYYIEQESIEVVHARSYSLIQLMLFENNTTARSQYVRTHIYDNAIASKIRWLDSKVSACTSIAEKYILMAIIEGIFFASSFAAIAFLRTSNIFTVTCQVNTLISRDEAIHTTASCIIYKNYLKEYKKPSIRRVHSLFKEAVGIECAFLHAKAPKYSTVLDLDAIYSFVRYSADRILTLLEIPTIYEEPKPSPDFPMTLMFTEDNTNFFERRNTAYSGCITNDL